jgi:catechol 2,3-dioxygenase-like lactoylglutathione lyase family enzyme
VFYSKLGFERIECPTHLKKPQEAEAFYADDAWLSNGKVIIYLIKGELEGLENIPTPAMGNISFYTSRAEETIALLQTTNVPFVANVRVIGSGIDEHRFRQAFIRDPDANYIEISNLKASTVAIKVSSEDSGTEEQSKPVVVGNIMRRLMSEADLRPSFNDAELDLEFDDDVIDQAMDLMKSLSDSHMTTVPTNILSFIDKHSREKSQQRLKSSRSASYLDAARKEKKNPAGIEELISPNTSSDIQAPMLRVNHLSLTVSDLKTSLKFYTEIMGLEEVKLPSTSKVDIGSVIAGDVIIHLVPGEPPKAQNPLEGQVFLNASGISTALRAFQEKKVPYRIHFAGDPAKSESNASLVEAFVSDPDGYVIVIGNYTEAAQKKGAIAGNISQIKPIPRQYQPTAVDSNVLRNFARRRKFEGDVCYQFNRNDLKKLLLQAGNDAPTALQLMKQHREKEAKKRAEKEVKSSKTQVEAEKASIASLICCVHCGGCC